jgi:hypothetical protein
VFEPSSVTRDAIPQETIDQTNTSVGKDLPCSSYDVGVTKRKLLHVEGVSSELRRSERLTKRART